MKENGRCYDGEKRAANGERSQDDSQDLMDGEKLYRLRETHVFLCVGPELVRAGEAIRRI